MNRTSVYQMIFLCMCISFFCFGCKKQEKETIAQQEQLQEFLYNDYQGALIRADKVRTDVIQVIDHYQELNSTLLNDVIDFWNSENYAYVSNELIDESTIDNTWYFNEGTRSTWEEAQMMTMEHFSLKNSTNYELVSVLRKQANQYQLFYNEYYQPVWSQSMTFADRTLECTYDPTHDWLQAVLQSKVEDGTINDGLFEYGRNGNSFLIQTETERLFVTYADVIDVNDILIGQQITGFSYSKLDGSVLKQYQNSEDSQEQMETDAFGNPIIEENPFVNYYINLDKSANVMIQYGLLDSIFPHITDIDSDWVTEAGEYSEVIQYDGKELTLTLKNPLSNKYEIIVFDDTGKVTQHKIQDTR